MRRRLTLAVVAVVAGALAVAGAGTWVLERRGARDQTRRELVEQARALADLATALPGRNPLLGLRRALRLEGAAIVAVLPGRAAGAALPPGVILDDGDRNRLAGGDTVSAVDGNLVWAAAPARRPGGLAAVVLSRRVASGARTAAPFFVVSAALALGGGALVADRLGRRFARPVTAAGEAARRIAAGDLAARADPGRDPAPELARLTSSLNAMAAELERARGQERQFLMSVSHDLRTPLTSVRGFAEAIADGTASDTRRAADVIGSEARRLERLVGDLLDLARLDARQFRLVPAPVALRPLVADTAEAFRPAADAAGIELVVAPPAPGGAAPVTAAVDPERTAQVVANLVENALKFAASRIEVAVARSGGEVEVSVTDDGPGIPPADLAHVFDRLFQSSRPAARQVGSGLGLAIVAELVAAMGGRVRATSAPGRTRVAITFTLGAGSSS